jgi:hypothetical protein
MDFGDFEVGIDRSLHRDDVIVTAKLVDERAKIGETQFGTVSASALGP